MKDNKITYGSIDEYIATFSPEIQDILQTLRQVIKESAPGAKEKISYQMPTFELHGNLVHFAAFKNPTPSGIEEFKEELKEYHKSKGTIQFPTGKPLPYEIISRIVKYRVASNMEKAKSKKKK
ncbi:iron chaperone [Paenibacillus beijingensis]|uniref:YdhG-like domain-containing protein n=1 Tax=Paenibacillus beijingensis TaxID=1126833 RepID=A0A0D5NPL2_9BACL|nr:DUF1801 domain-containing protein [Paenibacillus beijingensis]AJY76952.1 hypothetical protein VN24_23330 [Paenibacillus beijingensis]